ncbi:PAS domain-containing sensor histidine kinase [Zobellia nedashkovskayae]|uniref:PAS domain-containing sensor histidine kinase n=1 Tax=Zobellia nedashkovskayae TaxID=2779510 RepID=UPI00188A9043|nr:PAS domain S-box protein [Zobellia nedashkovskayae]
MKNDKKTMDDTSAITIRDMLRIGTWNLNIETGIYTLDKVTCEVLGIPYDTVVKRGDNSPYNKPDATTFLIEDGIEKLLETGEHFDQELEFKTPEGAVIWLHVIATRKLENEKCTAIAGIIQDITKTKQTQETFLRHNQLLKFAEHKAKLGHWNWDANSDTLMCSENMTYIVGVPADAPVPLSVLIDKVHPEDREFVRKQIAHNIKTKHYQSFNHRMVMPDGRVRIIQVSGDAILDDDGNLTNILGISQDITSYKTIEAELTKKNELLIFAEQKALLGHWELNTLTDEVYWSANLYYLFKQEENIKLEFNTYFECVHPEDQAEVTAHFAQAIEQKHFDKIIHRILLKDGTLKWIRLLGDVEVDENGNTVKLAGTCQDITEQQLQEIKFKGLVDSAPSATIIVASENMIQMVNKQAESLLGYTSEELVGKSINTLIPSRFDEIRAPHREKFLNNMEVTIVDLGVDFYLTHKSGREIPVEITLGPLQTDEGLLISMAVRDLTSSKIAEDKILKAKEDLEILTEELTAQNNQLADFTQITSHNLRAPVSNLNSLVEIYKMMGSEEERSELFKKFETVISHLSLTLNTLIEALSAKSHNSLERSELSFSNKLAKTKEIFSTEIERTKAVIKSDFSAVNSIRYNRIYMESIFQNLIGNALKYKSPERVPEIEITSKLDNGKIILSFKDNGLGIDLEKHGHKIFGLNKVFHNHPEAKGIGLFMTKTQIEAMGGKITVTSKVNEGTTFSVHFI